MRNAVVALVLLLGVSPAARAQSAAWGDKLFKGATSHDFGNVPRGAQLSHRFPLTNIYAVELQIVNVRTSCGCVTVTPAAKVLKSRQTSYIDVVMDARRFTGPKTVSIYVTVGPEYTSTATLRVSANSRADVVFNPGEVNFGVVPRGQTPTQTIDVEYAGPLDWQVTEIVKHTAPLDAKLEQLYRRPGQVGYRVTVTLKADAPAGELRHELQLKTNDRASPVLPVLVEATVRAPLTVSPKVIAMGTLKVNEEKTQKVLVGGNQPFTIVGIDGLGDGVTAELPRGAQRVHHLTIKCQPTRAGALKKQLTIRTNLDQGARETITVEADVSP